MYWTTGSGRIELNITKQIAAICSHQGSCDNDVNYVINNMPKVKKQLDAIPAELLANELKEYGLNPANISLIINKKTWKHI